VERTLVGCSERPRGRAATPGRGWTSGAGGLPKTFWGMLAVLWLGLSILLFMLEYTGYGGLIAILAAAAAVNIWW